MKDKYDFSRGVRGQFYRPNAVTIFPSKSEKIDSEAFVGIWRDRKDMLDGVKWLRNLRKKDWQR